MNTIEKYRRLVSQLSKHTTSDDVQWRLVGDGSTIQTKLGNYTVQISKAYRGAYEVDLLNEDGDSVDAFTDSQIEDDTDPFGSYAEILANIVTVAQRRATGADKVLDDVLSELDNIVPF